jgi:hypothetical protein
LARYPWDTLYILWIHCRTCTVSYQTSLLVPSDPAILWTRTAECRVVGPSSYLLELIAGCGGGRILCIGVAKFLDWCGKLFGLLWLNLPERTLLWLFGYLGHPSSFWFKYLAWLLSFSKCCGFKEWVVDRPQKNSLHVWRAMLSSQHSTLISLCHSCTKLHCI